MPANQPHLPLSTDINQSCEKQEMFSTSMFSYNTKPQPITRNKIKSHLLLEHMKRPSVPRPPQQGFPHWTPFLKSPGETSSPTPGGRSPLPSPLAEFDASVPELSTPLRSPQWEEMPARPGPTRTAGVWRARSWSSVRSSY